VFNSDERWVQRILNNLLVNAVWHSSGSKVLLGARRRGDSIVFEVRDNGRGMSQVKGAEVFEPVRRLSSSVAGHPSARSGLGLYIVQLLSERLGGSVECISSPECGTLFRVRLPGPVRYGQLAKPSRGVNVGDEHRNKLVAILDDDPRTLREAERYFVQAGVEVYADQDPLRWLGVITDLENMPDLVLLAYRLKGHDCSLQLDVINRRWSDRKPNVVVLTAAHADLVENILNAVPLIEKPISQAKLERLLDILKGTVSLPSSGYL
jgi:CheY-like chemotaxis protein